MASLDKIMIVTNPELRPCIVAKEHKALFHRWEDKAEVAAPSMLRGGHSGGQLAATVAIVEYEDGTVHEAYPHEVRFLDSKRLFSQYAFEDLDGK